MYVGYAGVPLCVRALGKGRGGGTGVSIEYLLGVGDPWQNNCVVRVNGYLYLKRYMYPQ